MAIYNFDQITDRRNTSCLKYDFSVERNHPKDVLPFWVADMDFPAPTEVIEELVNRSRHGIFGYTDVKNEYVETLRQWFTEHHHWTPEAGSLVVTPGVVYALCTAIRSFTKPGDAVLVQRPVYYPFLSSIEENNRYLINNALILRNGHYEIDFDDFEQKIIENDVKLFLLCNPHNPIGRVWRREELEKLGTICVKHHVVVVADEIHQEFVRTGYQHTVFASINSAFASITVTCTAPSKTFNLAGLQVSNIFIIDKTLRQLFLAEISASGYSQPNALGLFASQAAYTHGASWLNQVKAYLEENLQKTKVFLQRELPKIKLIEPEGTYLLWLDFREYHLSDKKLTSIMNDKANLWLDDGYVFGPEGTGFQRINIACPWATLAQGLEQLKKAFDNV